jgi:predicted membrane protein
MFASKKHHSIYSIVKYIYIYSSYWFHIDFILISYWFHIDFILYYCITTWLPRLKLHEITKAYQSKLNAQTLRRAVRWENGAFDEKPPKVVQHGLDMIGLRDNVLPIVGVLVEFSGYTCRPQVIWINVLL